MTNKEAIEVLKARISIYDCCKADHESNEAIYLAIKALKGKRPKGEWIKHSTYKDVLICSKCNHGSNQVYDTFNFCPNCGADMRKGGAE